jgi:hypothetical protein
MSGKLRRTSEYLAHMQEAIRRIAAYVRGIGLLRLAVS